MLSVGERLLANILLRAEQGAEALLARGGTWLPADSFRPEQASKGAVRSILNGVAAVGLVTVLVLRGRYGAL